ARVLLAGARGEFRSCRVSHSRECLQVDCASQRGLLVAVELLYAIDHEPNVGGPFADTDRDSAHYPLLALGWGESVRRRIVSLRDNSPVREPDRLSRVRVFNAGDDMSITHQMFDQHCVLEPAAAEAVREGDNREWHAALGDRCVLDRMRGNLSRKNLRPGVAELAAHDLVDLRKGVHLSRAREVLSFCAVGLRRRIPKVDHQLATEFGIGVVGTRCVRPVIANPPDAVRTCWRWDLLQRNGCLRPARRARKLKSSDRSAVQKGKQNVGKESRSHTRKVPRRPTARQAHLTMRLSMVGDKSLFHSSDAILGEEMTQACENAVYNTYTRR